MIRSRPITLLAGAAVPLVALVVAGCGSGGSTSTNASSPPLRTAGASSATVNAANTGLGATLVNSQGHTLYLFKKDKGTKSACFGACASAWPPVRVNGKPTAAGDAKASRISSTKRPDGPAQIVYRGHPLYLYQGDDKPGDANGQGVNAWGGRWFALSPAGKQVLKASKPKGGASGY